MRERGGEEDEGGRRPDNKGHVYCGDAFGVGDAALSEGFERQALPGAMVAHLLSIFRSVFPRHPFILIPSFMPDSIYNLHCSGCNLTLLSSGARRRPKPVAGCHYLFSYPCQVD